MFEKSYNEGKKQAPEYKKTFGNEFEDILIGALKKIPMIGKIEHGTDNEDKKGKADIIFTIKDRKGNEFSEPIAAQITISENEEKIKSKTETLPRFVKKEKRPGAEINWEGNIELVFVKFDKKDISRFWKNYEEKIAKGEKINSEDAIGNEIIIDFFSQVIKGVNPARREMLLDIMRQFKTGK